MINLVDEDEAIIRKCSFNRARSSVDRLRSFGIARLPELGTERPLRSAGRGEDLGLVDLG